MNEAGRLYVCQLSQQRWLVCLGLTGEVVVRVESPMDNFVERRAWPSNAWVDWNDAAS